jgi:hypothetical protein
VSAGGADEPENDSGPGGNIDVFRAARAGHDDSESSRSIKASKRASKALSAS